MIAVWLAYIWMIYLGAIAQRDGWVPIIHRPDRCDLSLFQLGLCLLHHLHHLLKKAMPIPVGFLRDVRLDRSVLIKADMREANLTGAMLVMAHLDRATLTGAILDNADPRDTNLTREQLASDRSFAGAKLPFA